MNLHEATKRVFAQQINERRQEAILQMRFRYLARAGKPIAGAYK